MKRYCMLPLLVVPLFAVRAATDAPLNVISMEKEIGKPGFFYLDPEFDAKSMLVCFDGGKNRAAQMSAIWVGKLDRNTGQFVDHNYVFIAKQAPYVFASNGPEWGYSQNGMAIYYTAFHEQSSTMHQFRFMNGESTELNPSSTFNTVANYPSKNPGDPECSVLAGIWPEALSGEEMPWTVIPEDHPENQVFFTIAVEGKGPRFIPGHRAVVTNQRYDGIVQIAWFDIDSSVYTQLTFDPVNKDSAQFFNAPEYGGELMFFARQNEDKEYGIYRNIGNKWTLVKTLYAPPGAVFYSGQSVSHKGKTYLSTAVLYSSSGNGVMYLCSMEDGRLIQVSKNDSTKRSMDLEVISTGEKLFAYYYDYLTGKLYLSVLQ